METARGLEYGTVKIANKIIDGSKITPPLKPIIRRATNDDAERVALAHPAADRNKRLTVRGGRGIENADHGGGDELHIVEIHAGIFLWHGNGG